MLTFKYNSYQRTRIQVKSKKREYNQIISESNRDNPKVGRGIGQGIGRERRWYFRYISFKPNFINTTSTSNHQRDLIFSSKLQGKQITYYATVRYAFVLYIQKSYGKVGQGTKGYEDIWSKCWLTNKKNIHQKRR